MRIKTKVQMNSPAKILKNKGLDRSGTAQRFHTQNVLNRITKYMPRQTGAMIKLTVLQTVVSRPEIVTDMPQARFLFHGKAMVDSVTGKGPANIPGIGYRWRKGAVLKATTRNLHYNKKNPQAGPRWDRAVSAAEGKAMAADLQRYLKRGG